MPSLLLSLMLLAASAQAAPPADEPVLDPAAAHALGAARARLDAVRERWLAAPPEARAFVTRLFQDLPPRLARSGMPPPAAVVARAWRALDPEGGDFEPPPPWPAALVDSLDLRVVPGAFPAQETGRGEPLTVHVQPLFEVLASETVELSLIWTSPTGEEQRARTEPVVPQAWAEPFAMYVRAPLSGPGLWRLVPELRTAAGAWRGVPIDVECIAELRARGAALAERYRAEPDGLARELAPRLAAALNHGARAGGGLPLSHWLELALDERGPVAAGAPEPLELSGFAGGALPAWTLSRPGAQPQGPIVVLATGRRGGAIELLTGPVGRAWAALQERLDALVVATDLPPLARGDEPTLAELLGHLSRERTGAGLVLVLRDEAGVLFPARLRGEGPHGVERLVLAGPPAGGLAPPKVGLELPILALDALSESPASERGDVPAPWTWLRRPEPPFLLDLAVPAAVGDWLESLGTGGETPR